MCDFKYNKYRFFYKLGFFLFVVDFCKDNTAQIIYLPHPTNCKSFIQCLKNVTYSRPCNSGHCFGIHETNACNFCVDVTCPTGKYSILINKCHKLDGIFRLFTERLFEH